MFRLTTKVKLAAGVAAGALTLGAAGAYAANANNNGTIPVSTLKPVALSGDAGGLTLNSTNGKTTTLTLPATFENQGQCVSFFAQHQDLVLKPAGTTTKISKNSHGKLISSTIKTWCESRLAPKTKTDSAETETPDATQSAAPETDSTDTTASQGQGHANGHAKHAHGTD
jgi:virulence-associated protein VagC